MAFTRTFSPVTAVVALWTMPLAALAPCASSIAMRMVAAALLLAPRSESLVVRSSVPTAAASPRNFSLLSIEQVPGPIPQYIDYGPPEFTTFGNESSACQACIKFFPEKEDGERFHSDLHEDRSGGTWARSCRVGPCDFRDPQTDPVGGVVGKGVGPGGKPDGKSCITRDPVPWYSDCEPIAMAATGTLLDVTRYCSYKEQMFIPPPAGTASRFAGEPKAWGRIGGTKEQCLSTIKKQGAALFDTMTFCDTDLPALSGCCESVFGALSCVAETAAARGLAPGAGAQSAIFASMDGEGAAMLQLFSEYCVPLCQNTKETFCEKYPSSDVCVAHQSCSNCTAAGGLWCPQLESCHCPGPKPPCEADPVRTPRQCLPPEAAEEEKGPGLEGPKEKAFIKRSKTEAEAVKESEEAVCKYAEMARQWKGREE